MKFFFLVYIKMVFYESINFYVYDLDCGNFLKMKR